MYQGIPNINKIGDIFRVQFVRRDPPIDIDLPFTDADDAIAKAKELQQKYPAGIKIGTDSPEYQLREYLKNLKKGSTFNRQDLQRKFYGTGPENQNDIGRIGVVLKEFANKNFKITKDPRKRNIRKKLSPKESRALNKKFSAAYGGLKGQELYKALVKAGKGKYVTTILAGVRRGDYSGEGSGSTQKNKIIKQLNKIKNNLSLQNFFKAGNFKTADIKKISETLAPILKTNSSIAARRVGDMAKALSGNKDYINFKTKDPNILKGAKRIASIVEKNVFKDLGGTFKRETYEDNVSQQLGYNKNYLRNVRQNYARLFRKILPGYSTDEIRNVATGAKAKSGAYSVFAQGIPNKMNIGTKTVVDNASELVELELQKLDPKSSTYNLDRTALKDAYNDVVTDFVKAANAKNKKGALPVRAFEISFDPPSKTVERYADLPQNITSNLDKTFDKFGYSYKVPKDILTLEELKSLRKDPAFLKRIVQAARLGPRAFAIPLVAGVAGYLGLSALGGSAVEAAEVTPAKVVEPQENLKYNSTLGSIVNTKTEEPADQLQVWEWLKENPVKTVAGTSIGFSAQEIPGAYKKARELGRGRTRSALGITGALKPVLTTFGTPAMTTLFEVPFAAKRLEEGETMTDVLTDPLGPALGLTFMEPLSRGAGVIRDAPKRTMAEGLRNYFNLQNVGQARPGVTSKILRMGMSPRMIAGASRFLGLPGLALSLGLTGYDAYKNYQNQEGMLYNLLNE